MFVDRGADHDDHIFCGGNDTGIRGRDQTVSHDALEHLVGSRLGERHDTALHQVHGSAVQVEECNVQAAVGEREAEGKPHVATAPNDDHIPLEFHSRPLRNPVHVGEPYQAQTRGPMLGEPGYPRHEAW